MSETGIAGVVIGFVGGIVGIYATLKNDLRAQYRSVCEQRDDWQKKFLASELARETLQKENVDLIRDALQQDREVRDLRRDLRDALRQNRTR